MGAGGLAVGSVLREHAVVDLLPGMGEDEWAGLVESVRAVGVETPVWVWRGLLVDGRHRVRAARSVGLSLAEVPVLDLGGIGEGEMVAAVVRANLLRRHLSVGQRALVAAELSAGSRRGLSLPEGALGVESAGRACGVGRLSVISARKVRRAGSSRLSAVVAGGHMSVGEAAWVADKVVGAGGGGGRAADEVVEIAVRHRGGVSSLRAKDLKAAWGERNRAVLRAQGEPGPPAGRFSVVVVDPPWPLAVTPRVDNPMGHGYDTLSVEEIAARPPPVDSPGWVFLWSTQTHLPSAFGLLEGWGLRYSGLLVWLKNGGPQMVGDLQRNGEYVLAGFSAGEDGDLAVVGVAGAPRYETTKAFFAVNPTWRMIAGEAPGADLWRRGAHSAKPEGFYRLVERVCGDVPRLDMYARGGRAGWSSWGKEAVQTSAASAS